MPGKQSADPGTRVGKVRRDSGGFRMLEPVTDEQQMENRDDDLGLDRHHWWDPPAGISTSSETG
jgi:hypothetical protein